MRARGRTTITRTALAFVIAIGASIGAAGCEDTASHCPQRAWAQGQMSENHGFPFGWSRDTVRGSWTWLTGGLGQSCVGQTAASGAFDHTQHRTYCSFKGNPGGWSDIDDCYDTNESQFPVTATGRLTGKFTWHTLGASGRYNIHIRVVGQKNGIGIPSCWQVRLEGNGPWDGGGSLECTGSQS